MSAFFITTFIHETSHFLTYTTFGYKPVLFHNYVQTSDQQIDNEVTIISALAGPVGSLIQGIIFSLVVFLRRKSTIRYLVFLWLGLLGFVNFFGYLVMTPLSGGGDTGKVAMLLHIDTFYTFSVAILGLASIVYLVIKLGTYFSIFIPFDASVDERRNYVYHIMFFPILIGSVINTLFAFPVPAILSIVYPATSSFVIMSSFGAIMKNPVLPAKGTGTSMENQVSKSLLILTGLCIIINRLLTLGLN